MEILASGKQPEKSPLPFYYIRPPLEGTICESESRPLSDTKPADALILGYPVFCIGSTKCLLFINHRADGILYSSKGKTQRALEALPKTVQSSTSRNMLLY